MYTQKSSLDEIKDGKCPACGSNRLLFKYSVVECTNCGNKIGSRSNKYNAKKTVAKDGIKRDSKFEASVADDLLLRKQAGDIKDYESQYRVDIPIHREDGLYALTVRHKVDFRILHNDGSYELLEAKGVETSDYVWRRKMLEHIWLPMHKDHIYTVIKQNSKKVLKKY
jgi:DNA-directed RNA polymerase subunit RPC12/RpoP